MANSNAVRFVKNLVAMFHKYPITPEAKDRLTFKLSHWKFTEPQWERVLDLIVDNRKEDEKGMPEMPEIVGAINMLQAEQAKGNQYGMLSFTLKGISYAIRCVHKDNIWVSVKTGTFPKLPLGAEDILMSPDNPPDPPIEEMPSEKERAEYLKKINANLERVKSI